MSANFTKLEVPHHSPADVRGYVAEALAILAELELERGEHAALLVALVNMLGAKTLQLVPVQPVDLALAGAPWPPARGL